MSPELLRAVIDGPKCSSTRESDCYALGMVIYEVSSSFFFHECLSFTHLRF